jgi:putative copper export protein
VVLLLTATGLYNTIMNVNRGALYQSLLGIKLLLVLHVFAVGIIIVKPKNPKRARQMTGIIISGLVIIAISAVLRQLHLN